MPVLSALIRTGACLLLLLFACPAQAHKSSDAYLTLAVQGRAIGGRWDIALRDLDFALFLDRDDDGAIRWGEVEAARATIETYASSHLLLTGDGRPCRWSVRDLLIDRHSDGAYAVLMLAGRCSSPPSRLGIDYSLFADVDPAHRGITRINAGAVQTTLVLGGDHARETVALTRSGGFGDIVSFVRTGVWHIWMGFDHILFLLSLLLPAVLRRDGHRWIAQDAFRDAAMEVLKVVSAFTLAHSLTLSLAALGVVEIPSRITESLIAASVAAAALNNVWPVVTRRVWCVAFLFGLLHGFGFANVLHDLALPRASLVRALFGFNIGVELGQLVIVCAVMPAAWAIRGRPFYRQGLMTGGSLAIALLASVWLAQRSLDLSI